MTDDQQPASPDNDPSAPATPAADDVAAEGNDPEATQAPAGELVVERDQFRDLLLRKTAEFDNFRKRVERERSVVAQRAAEDLLLALLPLVDDLERALAAPADTPDGDSFRAGVVLIHRQMLELLRKRDVTPIEAVGEPFDPNVHQAVAQEPSDEHPEGAVSNELRRGYRLGDRLLRAAMVIVSTGSNATDDASVETEEGAVASETDQP